MSDRCVIQHRVAAVVGVAKMICHRDRSLQQLSNIQAGDSRRQQTDWCEHRKPSADAVGNRKHVFKAGFVGQVAKLPAVTGDWHDKSFGIVTKLAFDESSKIAERHGRFHRAARLADHDNGRSSVCDGLVCGVGGSLFAQVQQRLLLIGIDVPAFVVNSGYAVAFAARQFVVIRVAQCIEHGLHAHVRSSDAQNHDAVCRFANSRRTVFDPSDKAVVAVFLQVQQQFFWPLNEPCVQRIFCRRNGRTALPQFDVV